MTITRNNLKVFKPELLGSSDEAGGQRTKTPVVSGKLNELFSAISDVGHAQSDIDIAKCYPALDTTDTAVLIDAHVFISEPPTDPLVSVMLVESEALDDADRMTDMIEIIESSVTMGSLIRDGAPGFLPNQNSFSQNYLRSTYFFNNKEYAKYTSLRVGQVIAISVEYLGVEDANWPRFTHYAMVTQLNAPGNSEGNIVFEPPITRATPEADVNINGETACTKLRLVNEATPLKFHGVTKLTAATASKNLSVVETKQNLLPAIVSEQTKSGVKLDDGGLIHKTISQVATSAQSYTFTVGDVLQGDNFNVDYRPIPSFISGGNIYGIDDAVVTVADGSVSVTLARKPDIGTNISLSYLSTANYQNYDNADAFPANRTLVPGTLTGLSTYQGSNLAFYERDGAIYINYASVEKRAGIVDYDLGVITLESGFTAVTFDALVKAVDAANSVSFVLNATDPLLDTFYVQVLTVAEQLISASSDNAGVITGSGISGTISNGLVSLSFTSGVQLASLSYDITEQVKLLPPADLYGLNPLRIPQGGVVDIFRPFGLVSIQHTQYQAVSGPANGQTKTIRAGARFVDITDANGASLWTTTDDHFTVDKAAGTVTLNSDFSGFTAPFVLVDTIGELATVTTVNSDELVLAKDLTQEYPINSVVSSVQKLGDLQARVGPVRDMTSWSNNWELDGDPATANLNTVDYPIELTNDTAINEDWVIIFTSATAFKLVGRRLGQIANGDTLNDFAPINPLTNSPYLTIRSGAFGGGWNAGEAIRFKTYAAAKPIMPIRSVQAGHSQITTDRAVLAFRGNES
ncbi:hypothetical protein [Shewanella colwelliana]|uniref:hypothetical protein n=1 Tax=Shewanella colwelliana TaxID=23 RepID=UPI0022AEA6E1|nr:hypothetical protein [Shewanella colwelliana]MCZ4339657.1 hypothetical protein [Shewanella colwelliana]